MPGAYGLKSFIVVGTQFLYNFACQFQIADIVGACVYGTVVIGAGAWLGDNDVVPRQNIHIVGFNHPGAVLVQEIPSVMAQTKIVCVCIIFPNPV